MYPIPTYSNNKMTDVYEPAVNLALNGFVLVYQQYIKNKKAKVWSQT